MADTTKTIDIITTFLVKKKFKSSEQIKEFEAYLSWQSNFSKQTQQAIDPMVKWNKSILQTTNSLKIGENVIATALTTHRGFGGVLTMNQELWKASHASILKNGTAMQKLATTTRFLTHGFRGFRMELLGVMFFGMGVQRAMFGILQPAFQMAGLFDLLSLIMGVVFLPIALALLDPLLQIGSWMMSLDENTRFWIGAIVLLVGVLGGFLFLIGMLGLGIGSLIQGLATFAPFLAGVGSAFSAFGILIGIVLAVIIALIIGFALAWQENFGRIKDWVALIWQGIKNIFGGMIQTIKGLWDILVGFFTGDTDKVVQGFFKVAEGIFKIIMGIGQAVWGGLITLGLSLFRLVFGILKSFWDFGVQIVTNIIDGIKSVGKKIFDTLMSFIPKGLKNMFGGFGNVGDKKVDDFILSGGKVIQTNPQDTLVGFKGNAPSLGGDNSAIIAVLMEILNETRANNSELRMMTFKGGSLLTSGSRNIASNLLAQNTNAVGG